MKPKRGLFTIIGGWAFIKHD